MPLADTDIPSVPVSSTLLDPDGRMTLAALVVALDLVSDDQEAREAIETGTVTLFKRRMKPINPDVLVDVIEGLIVRVGEDIGARVHLVQE